MATVRETDRLVVPDRDAEILAGFRALSDPLRLQVVQLLQSREMCVCDLCEALHVAQSKLSFHLKSLREAGLVIGRQEGRWIYYRLNLVQFVALEQFLAEYRRVATLFPTRHCSL